MAMIDVSTQPDGHSATGFASGYASSVEGSKNVTWCPAASKRSTLSKLVVSASVHAVPQPSAATIVIITLKFFIFDRLRSVGTWRELGDQALYISGFFRSSLNRQTISVDYYLSMGASAYSQLAGLLRAPGEGASLDAVYAELADSFEDCSEVLQTVRDAVRADAHSDILRLYEEWVTTGNPRTAERLRELGVVPMRAGPQTEPGC